MWDLKIHSPSRPSVLAGTHSPLQSTNVESHNSLPLGAQRPMWDLIIHPPLGPNVLDSLQLTNMVSHNSPSLGSQHSRWHTTQCLALIPFVTQPKPIASKYCLLWLVTYL